MPATTDALVVTYQRKVISVVCNECLQDVRKPRVTLTRDARSEPFVAQQFSCIEAFKPA